MATVKALLDEFCDRINQPRESTYATSTQPSARQFVSLLRFIAGELLSTNTNGWYILKRLYTFTNTINVSTYQLPGDFYQMLSETQWSVTNKVPLSGPLSNAALAFRNYGVVPNGVYSGYQVNGAQNYIYSTSPYTQRSAGTFQISPTAANSTDQNVIAYISSNVFWPTDWVTGTVYAAGAVVAGSGYMYRTAAGGTSGATRPVHTTGSASDGTVTWTVYTEPYPITADTDFCLFDDDIIIEGIRWSWYQAKKQDYEKLEQRWKNSVLGAIGRQNGSSVVNAGYNVDDQYQFPNTPIGKWSGTGGG